MVFVKYERRSLGEDVFVSISNGTALNLSSKAKDRLGLDRVHLFCDFETRQIALLPSEDGEFRVRPSCGLRQFGFSARSVLRDLGIEKKRVINRIPAEVQFIEKLGSNCLVFTVPQGEQPKQAG